MMLQRITRPRALAGLDPDRQARLVLTGQVALILVLVAAVGIPGNLRDGDHAMATGLGLLLVVSVGTPALSAGGQFAAARLLLVLGSPVLLLAPALLGGGVNAANLAALPYVVLTISLLPTLVFAPVAERRLRGASNLCMLLILLGHDLALARVGELPPPPEPAKAAQLILWLLLMASMRFVEARGTERTDG